MKLSGFQLISKFGVQLLRIVKSVISFCTGLLKIQMVSLISMILSHLEDGISLLLNYTKQQQQFVEQILI